MNAPMIADLLLGLSLLCCAAWVYLLCCRGGFWRARERLDGAPDTFDAWPPVAALVPARNEAGVIGECVAGLMAQDYPGPFRIVVVDDSSTDGTAEAAQQARAADSPHTLSVITAAPLPPGWAGKVWALSRGLAQAQAAYPETRYFWLTDADIAHDAPNLRRLVSKAAADRLDLVSQMVLLRSEGFWARFLIPAFVLFFQKLYPFAWVNDPRRRTAAAAGGSVLLSADALERIGGFAAIRDAIIDDCSLAKAVKIPDGGEGGGTQMGRIWLGLTTASESLRPYHGLAGVWRMVARSAFIQLRYSTGLLALTLLGMGMLYGAPPLIALAGAWLGLWPPAALGLAAWGLMTLSFLPILRLYGQPPAFAPALPLAGFLYSLMTLGSAVAYWRGRGGAWKGRTPAAGAADNASRQP